MAAAKGKKSKKKKTAAKHKTNGDDSRANGTKIETDHGPNDEDAEPDSTGDAVPHDTLSLDANGTRDEDESATRQDDVAVQASRTASLGYY